MERLLLKALHEEDFDHEHQEIYSFFSSDLDKFKNAFSEFATPSCKSYVCSVNPTNLALWFEALLAIWYHIFMCFLLLDLWYTIKTKVVVWKLGCEKIFHIKRYGQALTAKYKGLTVKVETKHLLKNWFPDYRFCFYQSNRSMVMRTT